MLETGKTYRNSKEVRDDIYILGKSEESNNSKTYAVYFLTRGLVPNTQVGEIELTSDQEKIWVSLEENSNE